MFTFIRYTQNALFMHAFFQFRFFPILPCIALYLSHNDKSADTINALYLTYFYIFKPDNLFC